LKKTNEIEELLDEIQFLTKLNLEQIAKSIKYTRPYLNQLKLKGDNKGNATALLRAKYAKELAQSQQSKLQKQLKQQKEEGEATLNERVKSLEAIVPVLVQQLASMMSRDSGDPVQTIIKKLYKASEDVGENLL
jgi:hypothetical protein